MTLQTIIAPAVEALGYELLGCVFRNGLLRVYIDKPEGIKVEDCEAASHQISGVLAVADPIHGSYTLEVSSPGMDRPLFTLEHYQRFTGHQVRLRLRVPLPERKNLIGIIQAIEENQILLLVEGQVFKVPFDNIERANLVPNY